MRKYNLTKGVSDGIDRGMKETNTRTELAPVKVGDKETKYFVNSKTGKRHTRNSFRDYTFACVHVYNGKSGHKEGSEFATWHSTLKNAKPRGYLLPYLKEFYTVEVSKEVK